MTKTLNTAQAKLLANFCSDVAKGLLFIDVAVPIFSKEVLLYRILLVLICSILVGDKSFKFLFGFIERS